jgi:hypothetical protein
MALQKANIPCTLGEFFPEDMTGVRNRLDKINKLHRFSSLMTAGTSLMERFCGEADLYQVVMKCKNGKIGQKLELCYSGTSGHGDSFVFRDPAIRPCLFYQDDEVAFAVVRTNGFNVAF